MTRFASVALVAVMMAGCITTDVNDVRPGMFQGNLKRLSNAYEQVDKLERPGKWSQGQIEQETGLDFKATNVERFPGPAAFQRIFGASVYQGALMDPKNGDKLLEESQHFKAYFITWKYLTTETDRYYFSTKDTYKKGDDLLILILFKDDRLFYCEYRYVKVNTHDSTNAFGQGVIDILKEYLGPASALNDLYQKIHDQVKPPTTTNP